MKTDRIPVSPLAISLLLLAGAGLSPDVRAADDEDLPAAINRVERETGGQVLSVERRTQSGREMNRMKVYTPEGRVRVMWDQPHPQQAAPGQAGRMPRGAGPRNVNPRETPNREVRPRPPQRDNR